jgi:DNA invertase Pin-like site-specific DNA recombinase
VSKRKAIYLRKSRDESNGAEDVLAKHRRICVELCEKRDWDYIIYEEVGSSDSLEARPQMMRLLGDIEDGMYDGVVVVDYDRLSRGDAMDYALINRTLRKADVKVYTPSRTYDLHDEMSEAMMSIEATFSRLEYNRIKRRLARGKRLGAAAGKWVQGNPPFPYIYDSEKKCVLVDETKRDAYLLMLGDALAGTSPGEIAIRLNTKGIATNRGRTWVAETVQRLLLNRFHMGEVIYGKTTSGDDRKPVDPHEWIRGIGDHERLKTPDEHARIVALISSRRRIANKSKEGRYPLSGIVKCARCGKTHQATEKYGRHVLFACTRRSPTGEICPNGGVRAAIVYQAIEIEAKNELERILLAVDETDSRAVGIEARIESLRRDLAEEKAALDTLIDLVARRKIKEEAFDQRRAPIEATIQRLETELIELESLSSSGAIPVEQKSALLGEILRGDFWTRSDWSDKDRHTLLTTLIDHIDLLTENEAGKQRKVVSVEIALTWRL